MTAKEDMAWAMEESHRTKFGWLVRERVTRKQGLTEMELANEVLIEYSHTFRENLRRAIDSRDIHCRNGRYYPGEGKQ